METFLSNHTTCSAAFVIDIPVALLKKCVLVEIKLYALGPYNLVFSSEACLDSLYLYRPDHVA